MEGIEKAVPSVELSSRLISYINDVLGLEIDSHRKKGLEQYATAREGSPVPFTIVRDVFRTLKDEGHAVYLHEMLSGSDVTLPAVTFPPRDPELEARVQKLRAAEEEREYRRMTHNVDPSVKQEVRFQEDVKSLNRQLIAVINFLVTVGGAFAFGYKGVEVALGAKIFPAQLMTGLIFATIVFFADLYFLLKYSPQ
ncbi:vacuolar ATPase assembly protein VMA12-like [Babylonia areolata]|uniref:vacuolar ATPase assembly protein VMA12-like n=1 Tax=Babylonia areolata TaxID=304850 RepID=UPI003FD465CC